MITSVLQHEAVVGLVTLLEQRIPETGNLRIHIFLSITPLSIFSVALIKAIGLNPWFCPSHSCWLRAGDISFYRPLVECLTET